MSLAINLITNDFFLLVIHGKSQLSFTTTFIGFYENILYFSLKRGYSLHGEDLIMVLLMVFVYDDVHCNVKCRLDFNKLKSISS